MGRPAADRLPGEHSRIFTRHVGRDVALTQRPQFDHQLIMGTAQFPETIAARTPNRTAPLSPTTDCQRQ